MGVHKCAEEALVQKWEEAVHQSEAHAGDPKSCLNLPNANLLAQAFHAQRSLPHRLLLNPLQLVSKDAF